MLEEGLPFGAVFPIVEKRFGAIFETKIFPVGVTNTFPMAMAHNARNRDVVLLHEVRD